MLSANAIHTARACRFCWMCRHLCPIGLATGREGNTPRAKGMLLDMVERGARYSASMAEEMYACCLCGACTVSCETGFDPRIFIREARTRAMVDGLMPAHVQPLVESALRYGNIFASKQGKNPAVAYASEKADILFYAGATAVMKTTRMVESAARLFKKAGVPFIAWEEEPASGAELFDLIGKVSDMVDSVTELISRIARSGVATVVVLDPAHAKVMRHDYPAWGRELPARVVTATEYFADLLGKGAITPKPVALDNATYHDPSRLARDLDETEPARNLLKGMGIAVREMFLNRQNTRCCGDELLAAHSPGIVRLTAKARWDDAADPVSFALLDSHKPEGKSVKSLFCLLSEACGA